jgi:hypothetical protein
MAGFCVSFESDWQKVSQKLDRVLSEGIRATLFEVGTAIIKETPVDTGRARGNWQASVNSAAGSELSRTSEGAAIVQLSQAASAAIGNTFFFTNNVPYIRRLEYGYSDQAPQGMVRRNLQNFNRLLAKNLKAAAK